jgi:hypothetical protein
MPIAKTRTAATPAPKPGTKPVSAKPNLHVVEGGKAEASEAVITVTTTTLEGGTVKGEPVVSETREVKVFATNPAHTGFKLGFNRNLGNMEMVKFEAFGSMPCYVEEYDSATVQIFEKTKAALELAIAEYTPPEPISNVAGDTDLQAPGEETGETAAESGEVTKEYIEGASREELEQLCTENAEQLGITPSDYVDDADLRDTIISVLFGEGEEAAAEDAPAAYTDAELMDATTDELKAIFEAWELGKYPPGPEKIAKKAAVKKILEKQAATAGE